MLFLSFSKGPGCLPYVFLTAYKLPTLIPVDGPTLSVYGIFVFGFYQHFLNCYIAFEVGIDTIYSTYLHNALSYSLCIGCDYASCIVLVLVGVPPCGVTAGVIIVFSTGFSLGIAHITVSLASVNEFLFYSV